MITFVALLMFVQQGMGWSHSTFLCGLLTLPWVLQSFVQVQVRRLRVLPRFLYLFEAGIFLMLVTLSFSFTGKWNSSYWIFLCLFVLCLFCTAHELAARMLYERMLPPRVQRIYDSSKMFFSQSAVVFTYGVMIVLVGTFEVVLYNHPHAIAQSWSMAVYLLAGVYLLLMIANLLLLPLRPVHARPTPEASSAKGITIRWPSFVTASSWKETCFVILSLFFLLLPQSLMFHTRVLFLMSSVADGGLGCSLQWIGLAQGTVGVIAFSAGLGCGHWLLQHVGRRPWLLSPATPRRLYWSMVIPLGLSPFVYWLMTQWPPSGLLPLCAATAVAQLCFGYGLNSCTTFIRRISGERYRSTISYLYIPLVSLVMLPPMALSGWLLVQHGFERFFAVDALLALPAWLAAHLGWKTSPSSPSPQHVL